MKRLESEDTEVVYDVTKNCPGCKVPISKAFGCNVMSCPNCSHEFCWMCLKPWAEHDDEHGRCSVFENSPDSELLLEKMRIF